MLIKITTFKYLNSNVLKSVLCLVIDNWNDYNYFSLYDCIYFDENGIKIELGKINIGMVGQKTNEYPNFKETELEVLPTNYFSLGREQYYSSIDRLGKVNREKILIAMNDIAFNLELFERFQDENVMKISFLRSTSEFEIRTQYSRAARGEAFLTPFEFKFYSHNSNYTAKEIELTFEVVPNSNPPTNIHVLIGRNGTGKTSILKDLILAFYKKSNDLKIIDNNDSDEFDSPPIISNLVNINFSSFDSPLEPIINVDSKTKIHYEYIGINALKSSTGNKNTNDFVDEYVESILTCCKKGIHDRWESVISILTSDPNFNTLNITSLIKKDKNIINDIENEKEFKMRNILAFTKLSSGHKMVLYTLTKLVELVEEKTLVLFDEPENHLHPPLLSAFIRALSYLLKNRNGLAIISTHSPVVLQEVPSSCVWRLDRFGSILNTTRLDIQTFGENIGTLTQEVFGLEVFNSGFYQILNKIFNENSNYELALGAFNNEISNEAKAILKSMYYQKELPNAKD